MGVRKSYFIILSFSTSKILLVLKFRCNVRHIIHNNCININNPRVKLPLNNKPSVSVVYHMLVAFHMAKNLVALSYSSLRISKCCFL